MNTIAENIHRSWSTPNKFLQFRKLCELHNPKYRYKCDIVNLQFTHVYEFKDGSSIIVGTDLSERDTKYFCEVKK